MPELPEVENYRRIASRAFGKRVRAARLKNPKVVSGIAPSRLTAFLTGRTLRGAARHGKHLFLTFGRGPWLALHFGLSGGLSYEERRAPRKGGALSLEFADGSALHYGALFGRLGLVGSPEEHARDLGLGPDALAVSRADFERIAAARAAFPAKALFMDQRNLAGVGNMYSDEALFRCRVHPLTRVSELSAKDRDCLYAAMRTVLTEMVRVRRRGERPFPKDYLSERREKGGRCPRCGGALRSVTVGGRAAWFCPACQPLARRLIRRRPAA